LRSSLGGCWWPRGGGATRVRASFTRVDVGDGLGAVSPREAGWARREEEE
jgi:hypothetical protein